MSKTKLCFVLSEDLMCEELDPANADTKYIKIQLLKTIVFLAVALCFVLSITELRIAFAIALALGLLIKWVVF